MIPVLLANVAPVIVAALAPNEWLEGHSWWLYGFQAVIMSVSLLRRAKFVAVLFAPSCLALVYSLLNLTLGSYLVPRGFGWNKEFTTTVASINHYQQIVPYLLAANICLYMLAWRLIGSLNREMSDADQEPAQRQVGFWPLDEAILCCVYVAMFAGLSFASIPSVFSLQMAIILLHSSDRSIRAGLLRTLSYFAYIGILIVTSFENKRELVMCLLAIFFVESYRARSRFSASFKNLLRFLAGTTAIFAVIVFASILRGYGNMDVTSLVGAVSAAPKYLSSELFVDGITDNLELNYNYGVTVTAMDHGLKGAIQYQLGATLIKPVFLLVPRDAVPYKPESMMQIFTREYAPDWWAEQGSMPVPFAAEAFLNFHWAGIGAILIVWYLIDRLFAVIFVARRQTFLVTSCMFLCATVLMFARGSGLEQWVLYYLLAAPFIVWACLLRRRIDRDFVFRKRWVV